MGEDFSLSLGRGRPGFEMDWEGERVIIKAAGAAKVAVQECMELMVADARANHPDYPPPGPPLGRFANRTDQTIDATRILEDARIDWSPADKPVITGHWGVEDRPAWQDQDFWREVRRYRRPREGELQRVSTVDRAMFLEFGTSRMEPRPFLYPAFDRYKVLLPAMVAGAWRAIRPFRPIRTRR